MLKIAARISAVLASTALH